MLDWREKRDRRDLKFEVPKTLNFRPRIVPLFYPPLTQNPEPRTILPISPAPLFSQVSRVCDLYNTLSWMPRQIRPPAPQGGDFFRPLDRIALADESLDHPAIIELQRSYSQRRRDPHHKATKIF